MRGCAPVSVEQFSVIAHNSSSDAFVLTLLGATNVALYDGSMTEWAADPALPLVTG